MENQISQMNKENKKVKILVQLIERTTIIEEFTNSKDIICPECLEPCRIKTENFKIPLFGCINNHSKNYKIKDFFDSQKINISNIICGKCKIKNKANSPNKEFYKCSTCNINLCLLCKSVHQSNHNIINYDQKNYICDKHNEHFIKYCKQCNKNICYSCDDEYEDHEIIPLSEIKLNKIEIKNYLTEMKKEIDIFNNSIKKIINELNELSDIMNIYYEINNNILKNYEKKNRNYQILQNVKQIDNNNEIYKSLKDINKIINIKDKFNNIIELYKNINSNDNEIKYESINENKEEKEILINNKKINITSNNKLNQMTIIYKVDKGEDKIQIFDSDFVKNNKNNCYLLIDGQRYELCELFKLNDIQKIKNSLEIKLIETKTITNMSFIFYYCTSLISLPDISKWNTINVTNMNSMFGGCYSLITFPDISKWNTTNVTMMHNMFYACKSLKSLPDISKWNTSKVTHMNWMFKLCSSLISLPEINNWNTINIINMNSMFYDCRSLISLPDISNWNISKVTDMSSMFYNCNSLKSFPDISKWIMNENIKKDSMFDGCNEKIIPKNF